MEDLDLELDMDLDIGKNEILTDYTTEELIEELKRRGIKQNQIKPNRGFNIDPSQYHRIVFIIDDPLKKEENEELRKRYIKRLKNLIS